MATTTVRRKATAFNPVQVFREHLTLKREAATITTRSEAQKKRLKEWMTGGSSEIYENENGSRFVDLPETVEVGGQPYRGMELRRSVSTSINEDRAEAILKRKGLYEKALTPVLDQDKIYLLVQTGELSEKDLDKMFDQKESFAFWPVKGEVL